MLTLWSLLLNVIDFWFNLKEGNGGVLKPFKY